MERLNPSRETKFSGAHEDRKIFIFSVQLTTSRMPINTYTPVVQLVTSKLFDVGT